MLPIINRNCLLIDVDAADKADVISRMVDRFDAEGYLSDRDLFEQDVLQREEILPTFIDFSIGLPHGKSEAVNSAGLCFARLNKKVTWGAQEEDKADFIVMIAIGRDADNLHLKVLSRLSRLLMRDEFRDTLKLGTPDQIYETLNTRLDLA